MLVEHLRKSKPAGQRAGRDGQCPCPLGAIGPDQRIPQGVVVRGPPGIVGERGIERDARERRLHESPGILVGAGPEQMELRCAFRPETFGRECRQQLDGPFRRALPQCKVRSQEVAPRRQIVGEGLFGKLVQCRGRIVRAPDIQEERDRLQHQVLGERAFRTSRQRHVLQRGLSVAAVFDETERRGFRHGLVRLAHLWRFARHEHAEGYRDEKNGLHRDDSEPIALTEPASRLRYEQFPLCREKCAQAVSLGSRAGRPRSQGKPRCGHATLRHHSRRRLRTWRRAGRTGHST